MAHAGVNVIGGRCCSLNSANVIHMKADQKQYNHSDRKQIFHRFTLSLHLYMAMRTAAALATQRISLAGPLLSVATDEPNHFFYFSLCFCQTANK